MNHDIRRFSRERYHRMAEATFDEVRKLAQLKGGEYSGDDDRLANFRRNAADLGMPYEAVWRVYAAKHWDAIGQYVRDRVSGTQRERLEGLDGRVNDLIVYLLLFKAMLIEDTEGRQRQSAIAAMQAGSSASGADAMLKAGALYAAADAVDAYHEKDVKDRGVPAAK